MKRFVQNQAQSNKLCRNLRQSRHKIKMRHNILKAAGLFFLPKGEIKFRGWGRDAGSGGGGGVTLDDVVMTHVRSN